MKCPNCDSEFMRTPKSRAMCCTPECARQRHLKQQVAARRDGDATAIAPVPMRLTCPACNELHIDEGEFATKAHHTHACQACGNVWRPAVVATVGVRFLPGFKNGGGS